MRRLSICLFMFILPWLPTWSALASQTCSICLTEPGQSHLGCNEHPCCRTCAIEAASHDLLYFDRGVVGCYVRSCAARLSQDAVAALVGPEVMRRAVLAETERSKATIFVCSNGSCSGEDLALGPLRRGIRNRLELECRDCKTLTCLFCGESVPAPKLKRRFFYNRLVQAQHHCGKYHANLLRQQLETEDPEKGIKPCPKCFVLVHRFEGCHRMVCTCGAKFCWDCLESEHHDTGSCEGHIDEDHFWSWVEISVSIERAFRNAEAASIQLTHGFVRIVKSKRKYLSTRGQRRHAMHEAVAADPTTIVVRMVDRDEIDD